MKDLIKKKKTELTTLVNQAQALQIDLEGKHGRGETIDPLESTKLNNMVEAGQALRADIKRMEDIEKLGELAADVDGGASGGPASREQGKSSAENQGRQFKSWGAAFVGHDNYKNWQTMGNGKREVMPVNVKAITSAQANAVGGFSILQDRRPEILDAARIRPRRFLEMLNVSPTTSDSVEYVRLKTVTNNAAVVPEYSGGNFGLKPQSTMDFELASAPVKTVSHWIAASRQVLMDGPRLQNLIDVKGTDMLEVVLENEILFGDGTGDHFTGLLHTANIPRRIMGADGVHQGRGQKASDSKADTIRRAITDIRLKFYNPNAIVLSPGDAEDLELSKDNQGRYLNIYDPVAQRIWRVNVVETPALTDLTGVVGDFAQGCTLFDRMNTEIRVGEPGDFFLRNAVAISFDVRAAFVAEDINAFEQLTMVNS